MVVLFLLTQAPLDLKEDVSALTPSVLHPKYFPSTSILFDTAYAIDVELKQFFFDIGICYAPCDN